MEKIKSYNAAVCDAGPVIHLDELGSLDLLSDFHPLLISKTVQSEIIKHRPTAFKSAGFEIKLVDLIPWREK